MELTKLNGDISLFLSCFCSLYVIKRCSLSHTIWQIPPHSPLAVHSVFHGVTWCFSSQKGGWNLIGSWVQISTTFHEMCFLSCKLNDDCTAMKHLNAGVNIDKTKRFIKIPWHFMGCWCWHRAGLLGFHFIVTEKRYDNKFSELNCKQQLLFVCPCEVVLYIGYMQQLT